MALTKCILGDRIGIGANISTGCSATIFSNNRNKILLTKRIDNQLWCLPGGRIEGGENAIETCIREVKEETGMDVVVKGLLGVYSTPNMLVEYPDGNRYQIVALNFEAEIISGTFLANEEVSEAGFFSEFEIKSMPIFEVHLERIKDVLNIVSNQVLIK